MLIGTAALLGVPALPGLAGWPGLVVSGPISGAAAPAPEVLCATEDRRLAELSGLAADGQGGLWAITDGGRGRVFQLGEDCGVRGTRSLGVAVDDLEDMARTPDGTLWLADIGDNERSRDAVAVHLLRPNGRVETYRMRYPDGPHDAEALLVGRDGAPVLVTKELLAAPGVYRPEGPLGLAGVTVLRQVGTVSLPDSDTRGGPLGGFGSRMVTGGATSANGMVAALRTYTDAWLFAAPDGDLASALAGPPVRVPLPDEPQGEAIAFDGRGALLSGSERRAGVPGRLRRVPGAASLVRAGGPAGPARAAAPTGERAPAGEQAPTGNAAADRGSAPTPLGIWAWPAGGLALAGVGLLLLRRARASRSR